DAARPSSLDRPHEMRHIHRDRVIDRFGGFIKEKESRPNVGDTVISGPSDGHLLAGANDPLFMEVCNMIQRRLSSKLSVLAALSRGETALMAACGSTDGSSSSTKGAGGAGNTGTMGSNVGGGFLAGANVSNGPGAGVGGGCAGTSSKAQLLPLDMYIMLD